MKCDKCVYYCKCREIPVEGNGCGDFKDRDLFVELPFRVNQLVYKIEYASKYVPVIIDGVAYFKIEDDSRVEQHCFSGEDLQKFLEPVLFVREVPEYFATRAEAEKALSERVKKNG